MHNVSKFPVVPFAILSAVVVAGLMWSRLNAAPAVPVAVIAGLDTSASVRVKNAVGGTQLGQSRAALSHLAAGLRSDTDQLIVARIDREVSEFYDDAP